MFKIKPNPSFKAKVLLRIPGEAKPIAVEFEFRHFSQSKWEGIGEKTMRDALTDDIVIGWSGIDEAFSQEALLELFDQFPGTVAAVFETFMSELYGAKQKN